MSVPHHGDESQVDLFKKFMQQEQNPIEQTFSKGKMNEDDKGDLYYKVGYNMEKRLVIVEFSHNVKWMAFEQEDAENLRDALTESLHRIRGII